MPPPLPPFVFPTLPSTWFIGHMSRALREMSLLIQSQKVDLVIETRDSRLPLTSINPTFESILNNIQSGGLDAGVEDGRMGGQCKRLIVYNKRDLGQECFVEPLKRALALQGQSEVIFTDSRSDADIKLLLKTAIRMAARPLDGPDDKISILIAGMPNVGKSSILNSLRRVGVSKGKAASTSSAPGHTRRLSTVIKISLSPPTYIYDTPGIMVPYLGKGVKGSETALKLALTGGIKESLFEGDTVAEYLVWRLWGRCRAKEGGYSKTQLLTALALPPTTSLSSPAHFLRALAIRLSAIKKGGEPDVDFAAHWLVLAFRTGKLGQWTLDGMGRGGEMIDYPAPGEEIEGEEPKGLPIYWSSPAPAIPTPVEVSSSAPPTPSPAVISDVDAKIISDSVHASVAAYFASLASPDASGVSGHQQKKLTKVAQARVRETKRKAQEVTKVSGVGGKGAGKGIASARRKNYRR